MKAVRIRLTQSQANYRKAETIDNKMTYPLPPLSTVIGAIHNACGYDVYHKMDVSVQGKYGSLQRETYTDYAFLNSTMNDRGILVKLKNSTSLSTAYEVAAKANAQGADFDKEDKITVINRALLDEYQSIRIKRRQLDQQKKCNLDIDVGELKKQLDMQYSQFASLTTSLKYYEVLYDVELIIHIVSDEKTMQDIYDHVYDIRSIGRSEDFVDVTDVEIVELSETLKNIINPLSGYLSCEAVEQDAVALTEKDVGIRAKGTKYYMSKEYQKINNQRIYNKKWVLYTSNYGIDTGCEPGGQYGIYHDGQYIVSLL